MARIMVIHHSASIGGGSISFLDVLDMLKEEHEVIACCPKGSKDFQEYAKARGHNLIPIDIPIPVFNHYSGGTSFFSRTFWKGILNIKHKKQLKLFIQGYDPDVVIVNSSVMCMLGPIIKEAGAKAVCFVRETFVEGALNLRTKVMLNMLNSNFHGVLFISKYDKEYASLNNPLTAVVADCVDETSLQIKEREEALENLQVPKEKFNVLYAGGAARIKGLDVMLNALTYIKDPKINLIIAGDMNFDKQNNKVKALIKDILNYKESLYLKKIEGLLQNQEIASKITFVGVQKNMSDCYSAADVVVFPSNVPHQARGVFEGGMYSCPIIISDFKQTSEYVENYVNGITFKPKSAEDLASVIVKLSSSPGICASLGKKNKEMGEAYHNFNIEKDKLNKFIRKLLG